MFFILSKILYYIFSPISLILLSFLLFSLAKKEIIKKYAFRCGIGFILLFTNSFIINELFRAWEVKPTNMNTITEKYDIAIVLTGMTKMQTGYDDRVHFAEGIDRLLHPYQLYRKGMVKKILITGGSGSLVNQEDREADQLKSFLLDLGMPENDIIIERDSRNTRENALFTQKLIKEKYPEAKKLLMVTSAFHMRRSMGCFEKVGLAVTPFSTDFYTNKRVFYPNVLFLPSEAALFKWFVLYHEILGYCMYKISGYC